MASFKWGDVGTAVANGVRQAATHTARAAAAANGVSKSAQTAQGLFNQDSANNANAIGSQRILDQYAYNSAQAAMANQFSEYMWDKSAAWNEAMFNRQMEFNAEQAQLNRDWQERMDNTKYQRSMKDMQAAGLNPILAAGGLSVGSVGGGAASVSSPSMSGISGAMGTGGLMNGLSASEGNYTGQMEYMSGMLGLFGAAVDGISTAMQVMSQTGNDNIIGQMIESFADLIKGPTAGEKEGDYSPYKSPSLKETLDGSKLFKSKGIGKNNP